MANTRRFFCLETNEHLNSLLSLCPPFSTFIIARTCCPIVTARIRSMTGRYCFHRCLSVNISGGGGGYLVSDFRGGVPGFRFSGRGYLVSDFRGGGGYLVLVKGKIFDSRFGLIHVQTGGKKFLLRDPPPAIARKLPRLHGGRYASCVHAGGLSCSNLVSCPSYVPSK